MQLRHRRATFCTDLPARPRRATETHTRDRRACAGIRRRPPGGPAASGARRRVAGRVGEGWSRGGRAPEVRPRRATHDGRVSLQHAHARLCMTPAPPTACALPACWRRRSPLMPRRPRAQVLQSRRRSSTAPTRSRAAAAAKAAAAACPSAARTSREAPHLCLVVVGVSLLSAKRARLDPRGAPYVRRQSSLEYGTYVLTVVGV